MDKIALIQWPHTTDVLQRYAAEFIQRYRMSLVENGRPATGRLIDSLSYQVVVGDQSFAVDISLMDYWRYIENGTAPHWPPSEAIRQWIEAKPVIPQPDSRGRIPTPAQLTYLIQRKIARFGTQGTHDLQATNEQLLSEMQESLADAVTEDVGAYVSAIFADFLPR